MKEKTILIQVAMEIEAEALQKKLINVQEKTIHGYKFYEGTINNYKIVILLSGVGLINASSAITIAILEYNPSIIINYGIAGAMSKFIHTKDIVIGTKVVNINSYRTTELKEGEGSNPNTWELLTFLSGEPDKYIEYNANKNLIDLTKNIEYKNGNIIYGTVGSGDAWNREVDRILYLNKEHNVICEDMESIAIYSVSNKFNIPTITIKIISDNSLINEEYDRNVAEYLRDYLYEYLLTIINNL